MVAAPLAGDVAFDRDVVGRVGQDQVEDVIADGGIAVQVARIAAEGELLGQPLLDADLPVDRQVVGRQVHAHALPPGEGAAQQRAAHTHERIEHPAARLGEKADDVGHELRRLGRGVRAAQVVAVRLGSAHRVGRSLHRLQEVDPLAPGQVVEPVARVDRRRLAHGPHRT